MDSFTPAQRRTVDELIAKGSPRPVFSADLAHRLRAELRLALEPLDLPRPVWLGKHRMNDLGKCEGLFQAGLAGETPPFRHRRQTAAGSLAHKSIEIDVPRRRADDVATVVDRAVRQLAATDEAFGPYWRGLDDIEASDVCAEATRLVEQFRMTFPPMPGAWTPMVEFPIRQEFGRVTVSGRVDLVIGGQDLEEPMRARRLAVDLKTGRAWPEFPEDMRLYALLLTLRTGVPPFRVASVFLDSGEWQAEDVSEQVLFHAAGRVIETAHAWAALVGGRAPALRPGPYCRWCPKAPTCPALAAVSRGSADVVS